MKQNRYLMKKYSAILKLITVLHFSVSVAYAQGISTFQNYAIQTLDSIYSKFGNTKNQLLA